MAIQKLSIFEASFMLNTCRVTYHVVPVGGRVLRCDDDGFSFMPVLDDVKQYGTLLGVERHDEQVVKDE